MEWFVWAPNSTLNSNHLALNASQQKLNPYLLSQKYCNNFYGCLRQEKVGLEFNWRFWASWALKTSPHSTDPPPLSKAKGKALISTWTSRNRSNNCYGWLHMHFACSWSRQSTIDCSSIKATLTFVDPEVWLSDSGNIMDLTSDSVATSPEI